MKQVAVLDYGSGNIRSVVRMLERVGAQVELTCDPVLVAGADALYVPGVGNFHACVAGLRAVGGDSMMRERLSEQAPVLGVCVGFQIMFQGSSEHHTAAAGDGLGLWPGQVTRLDAPVVPHMGWSRVHVATGSKLFSGIEQEYFYFVHSYAVTTMPSSPGPGSAATPAPLVTTARHGAPFIAAIEDGPLAGTQFHPEKSGDAGATFIENWLSSL